MGQAEVLGMSANTANDWQLTWRLFEYDSGLILAKPTCRSHGKPNTKRYGRGARKWCVCSNKAKRNKSHAEVGLILALHLFLGWRTNKKRRAAANNEISQRTSGWRGRVKIVKKYTTEISSFTLHMSFGNSCGLGTS